MSLFDVIKYPISVPPTLEELNALPDEIFNQWRSSAFLFPVDRLAAYQIFQVLYSRANINHNNTRYDKNINELKRIIKDYNEPL